MKKIKDIVELSGMSRRTLQYYDDTGLMDNRRTKENYRLYEEDDLVRIWKIILYKEMDFRLGEIKLLLNADERDVDIMLKEKAIDVERRIAELQRILEFIDKVIADGLPDMSSSGFDASSETLLDIAGRLSKRV